MARTFLTGLTAAMIAAAPALGAGAAQAGPNNPNSGAPQIAPVRPDVTLRAPNAFRDYEPGALRKTNPHKGRRGAIVAPSAAQGGSGAEQTQASEARTPSRVRNRGRGKQSRSNDDGPR